MNFFFKPKNIFDNNTSYSCCEDKIIVNYYDFCNVSLNKEEKEIKYEEINLQNISTKSVIQINKFLLVFKSNKITSKGKDSLIFFNIILKREINIKLKRNYSFVYSAYGLAVMPIERDRNENKNAYKYKVLLCACK